MKYLFLILKYSKLNSEVKNSKSPNYQSFIVIEYFNILENRHTERNIASTSSSFGQKNQRPNKV
jgi:hypothetical protein